MRLLGVFALLARGVFRVGTEDAFFLRWMARL